MIPVIDLGLDIPQTIEQMSETIRTYLLDENALGFANYQRIFGPQWLKNFGVTPEMIAEMRAGLSEEDFAEKILAIAGQFVITKQEFFKELDKANIRWGLVSSDDCQAAAEFAALAPERIKISYSGNPIKGMPGVRAFEEAVREFGFSALNVDAFYSGIPASDGIFFPLYAKAAELDVPVFIYTAMNYRTDLPMDVAHPIHVDRVAMRFPRLKIVASCGGWPWVPDMVGIARRHRNVYINTRSHRPKYLAKHGSGWEMLMQFGNTLLQDQIVFSSGAEELGLPVSALVKEVKALPLKDKVIEKWLYHNAEILFHTD
jgi:hypothetical protein